MSTSSDTVTQLPPRIAKFRQDGTALNNYLGRAQQDIKVETIVKYDPHVIIFAYLKNRITIKKLLIEASQKVQQSCMHRLNTILIKSPPFPIRSSSEECRHRCQNLYMTCMADLNTAKDNMDVVKEAEMNLLLTFEARLATHEASKRSEAEKDFMAKALKDTIDDLRMWQGENPFLGRYEEVERAVNAAEKDLAERAQEDTSRGLDILRIP